MEGLGDAVRVCDVCFEAMLSVVLSRSMNQTSRVEGPLFDVLNSFHVLHASLKEESE